jgi:hypothetical protein
MAKLGSDFNSSQPTDADLVRNPTAPNLASTIRELRYRIQQFFATLFNPETGDFQDNVLPSSCLIAPDSSPSSGDTPFTQVTVDRRGFVVKGSKDPTITAPRAYRSLLLTTGGWREEEQLVSLVAPPSSQWPIGKIPKPDDRVLNFGAEHSFLVPPGVSKMSFYLSSGGAVSTTNGVRPGITYGEVRAVPGTYLRAFVGDAASHSFICDRDYTWWVRSDGQNVTTGVPSLANGVTEHFNDKSRYRPYGTGSNPGMILFEWYA